MPNPDPATATAPPPTAERPPAWLERETRPALASRPLRAQLADPDAWTDRHGHRHAVKEMSPAQARVVMRRLRRRARGLHRVAVAVAEYLLVPYPPRQHPQAVVDAAHQQLADTDPHAWLNQTPLMRALSARARTR
jgi:hypothetical protein